MNRSDLLELVNINTERKWEKYGTMNGVLSTVAKDFCKRNRFWWRQMLVSFQTVSGQGTYDLTAAGVITNADLSEIKIEEIVIVATTEVIQQIIAANGGFGFDFGFGFDDKGGGGGVTTAGRMGELVPIFDPIAQIGILSNPTPTGPSRYFFGYNDDHTLVMDPADNVYTLWMAFWGLPNTRSDSTSPTIPLIPEQFHDDVLRSGMEAYIWEHVYGSSNPKYVLAKKDYEDGIMLAQGRPRFTTNYNQQLVSSECAIRST